MDEECSLKVTISHLLQKEMTMKPGESQKMLLLELKVFFIHFNPEEKKNFFFFDSNSYKRNWNNQNWCFPSLTTF